MNATLIDFNEYKLSGEGANGESFFHKSNPETMVKLYFATADTGVILNELELSRKVYALGIPVPKPGELITDGNGRYGIRFQRLVGKVSFCRATGDEPHRVEEFARRFAKMCLNLHRTELDTSQFQSGKERDLKVLETSPFFTPEEKDRLTRFISDIPDTCTALHGDLQYSNAVMTPSGDYFIDLGDFAYGHPYLDLGQVMLCCLHSPEEFIRGNFHLEPETAREFWKFFVKEYFGDDAYVREITRILTPYSGIMSIFIDRCVGARLEVYHKNIPQ